MELRVAYASGRDFTSEVHNFRTPDIPHRDYLPIRLVRTAV